MMKRVLLIVANDLRRRFRSPVAVIMIMLIPIVSTLIIGLVFGRSGDVGLPRITVLLVDEDGGIMGNFVQQAMREGELAEMVNLVPVSAEEGTARMEKGKASAMITIPAGFTANILDLKPDTIQVLKNPAESFLPVIAEEITVTVALLLDRMNRLFADQITDARSILEGDEWPTGDELQRILDGAHNKIILAQGYVSDSLITYSAVDAAADEPQQAGFNLFAYVMPGMLILGLLFISEISMRDIFRERGTGTMGRIFSAPVEVHHFIAGKICSTFLLTSCACIILLIVSRFGFRIGMGRPVPLTVHFVGTMLMCTGIVTVFYGFIRTERAADAVMSIVIVVMALIGGSMVPIEAMGEEVRRVARFSPVFWASDGFKKIFTEDWGLTQLSLHLLIMYGLAAITITLGTIMLKRRIAKGG